MRFRIVRRPRYGLNTLRKVQEKQPRSWTQSQVWMLSVDTETECLEICVAFHGTHGMQSNLAVAKAFFQSNENIFKGKKWKTQTLAKHRSRCQSILLTLPLNKVQIPTCTVFANAHDRTSKAEDAGCYHSEKARAMKEFFCTKHPTLGGVWIRRSNSRSLVPPSCEKKENTNNKISEKSNIFWEVSHNNITYHIKISKSIKSCHG